MFAEADNKDYTEIMRSMGFRPVPLEYSDILTGLTAGNMIESLASAPFYAEAGQFYTAAKHMLQINWVPLSGGIVIHRKTWEAFSTEKQAYLVKTSTETAEQIQRSSREESDKAVAAMQKRGLTVHPLPPGGEAKWEAFAQQIMQLVRGRLVPADMFDQVQTTLAEYRKSQPKEAKP
jgi:TRAP-type C4-dicarboxylate transport system substrate-binding protein